ncbi:MAG: SUMF1/EgtB/PvdO family nonheme iron enzyme [Cyanobacteria bacterium]|nr:SUMF1/EgtB/PvdO family nonheme iron enzyme [Cyanobacteriota bacterium]
MSAIFISHSHRDNAWAERIRDWLLDTEKKREEEQRYRSFFLDIDEENGIDVGERWRDQLFEHLQLSAAVLVICSEAYASSQWCLAELGVAMAAGKLVLPVRIDASPLPKLLSETQATALAVIDLEQGSAAGWSRLQKGLEPLSWQLRQPWPPQKERNPSPFPGLDCFERKHAAVFFGQEVVREKVLAAIRRLPARQSRLLLLLGASGCGKSSLLRAGVMPWFAADDRGRWIVFEPFRPEEKPFEALESALARAHQNLKQPVPTEPVRTAAALGQQLRRLRLAAGQQDARIVIAIDQFEELLAREDGRGDGVGEEADAFLTQLAELLGQKNSQVLILATLRSDFYGLLQLHPSALHRRAGDPIPLGPMDVDGFRQVIEGPAQRVGVRLERGLSDRLVRDTPSGDALPLLAFTLRELWDGRADGAGLTLKQYDDFGGLAGAVQRKADEVLATSGATDEEIEELERAFIDHLVRLTSDGQAAKQPARQEALPAASRRLVGLFVEARLLVSGKGSDGDAVEIAHEALLRTWPKLVGWIDKGREALLQRLRVRRLGEDLNATAPERQRRQALEQLAALAASGGDEAQAVEREGAQSLADLLAAAEAPEADRQDAALVLALIGAEQPLRVCLADTAAPVALRRRAAESLGLLAKRSGDRDQRDRIAAELEGWLCSEMLDVRIEAVSEPTAVAAAREAAQLQVATRVAQARASDQLGTITEAQLRQRILEAEEQIAQQELWAMGASPGWAEHDARLPLLQGASRGLQLAASADLPLLGSGPGQLVPMLTLTAEEEGSGLRIRSEVVKREVWKLPLAAGEQLELVVVEGGEYWIGSPKEEAGRSVYSEERLRQKCEGVDVEALRKVRLMSYAMVRHPISQAQWRAVVEGVAPDQRGQLEPSPYTFREEDSWERYGQPGALPVDSVSWNQCQQWLEALNGWLASQWPEWAEQNPGLSSQVLQLALPSESQWEAACRAVKASSAEAPKSPPFHFGATVDPSWARYGASYTYGRGRRGDYKKRPVPIGFFGLVNRCGLAEMHGQLQEWCADQWHRSPIPADVGKRRGWFGGGGTTQALLDGSALEGPDSGLAEVPREQEMKLLRGGSWIINPHNARAAFRHSNHPFNVSTSIGVRPGCFSPPGSLLGS